MAYKPDLASSRYFLFNKMSLKYRIVTWSFFGLLATTEISGQEPIVEFDGLVAVHTFSNISRHPTDNWIGRGTAETIITALEARGVAVLPRTQSRNNSTALRQSDTSSGTASAAVGIQTEMQWTITGSYQRLGDQLRLTSRLTEASTGTIRRVVTIDGQQSALFELQDQLVAELMLGFSDDADLLLRGERRQTQPDRSGRASQQTRPELRTTDAARGRFIIGQDSPVAASETPSPSTRPRSEMTEAGILTGRPSIRPARAVMPPRIDGRLDDPVWQEATRITEFVQQTPLDGAPATEQTEIFAAYDSENLYFGIYAHYSDIELIRANRSDRDQTFSDDTVAFYFDPFIDQQRAYIFSVNGYGVQADALLESSSQQSMATSSGGGGATRPGGGGSPASGRGGMGAAIAASMGGPPTGDSSWDALFQSSGTFVEDGWTAELTIPFKSLRYPRRGLGEAHRWGFQVARTIPSKDEANVWAPVSRGVAGFLTQMGLLEGLTDLSASRNIEILPTFTAIQYGSLDTSTGGFNKETQPEGALNLKYGVTPNLTADFTYNPDFSQIESDIPQVEVNQRFPLFFPELRPFFLEGQEVFTVPGQVNLLHTRTVVDPRYGAKLTGKIGNTTLGALIANDEAPGKRNDPGDPAYGKTGQVFVGRARYDLYAESSVGLIATDRQFLDSHSRVVGADARFRLGRTAALTFLYAGSQHRDEDGAERSGPTAHVAYNRQGRNLSYGASVDTVDPDFRTDTGFVQRVDTRNVRTNASYRWWPGNKVINWGPLASYGRIYDFSGVLQDEQTSLGVMSTLSNNIITIANINRDMERYEGLEFSKTQAFLGGAVSASRRLSAGGFLMVGDQIRYSDTPFLGQSVTATAFVGLRPMSRLNADLTLITSRLHDPRSDNLVFDVKIFRTFTTYQFTNRLLLRNIMEYNTLSRTLGANLLFTYRVNAGTVFFIGYDDHYEQENLLDAVRYPTTALRRTNRAFFTKLSYLFRY